MAFSTSQAAANHRVRPNLVTSRPKRVLIVVANPSVANTVGWPVGFWGAELAHPYYELTERGIEVTIASPDGGKVELDALSDPRDPSRWSAGDLITLGFVNAPELMARLEDTPAVGALDPGDYDALMVAGGLSPMFTYRGHVELARTIVRAYEAEKPVALYCHGTAALVDLKLSDGTYLVAGKTVTGFANVEEDYSDAFVGRQVMPWRVEDALRERGANYVQAGLFKAFAIRDGRLITGQQQYSSRLVAEAVIAASGV